MSRDSVASHKKFKTKFEIPFTLLSDPDGEVCKKYGVLKKKNVFGKLGFGIERSTFVIDGTGTITKVYRGVNVKGHARAVLEAL